MLFILGRNCSKQKERQQTRRSSSPIGGELGSLVWSCPMTPKSPGSCFYFVELSLQQRPPIITWTRANADWGKETQSTGAPGDILSNRNYAANVTYSPRRVQDGTWEPHLSDLIPHVKGKARQDPARAKQLGRNVPLSLWQDVQLYMPLWGGNVLSHPGSLGAHKTHRDHP